MSKKITIDGFNGTGKATLAKALAKRIFLRVPSDVFSI